jgi:hypothetical protein
MLVERSSHKALNIAHDHCSVRVRTPSYFVFHVSWDPHLKTDLSRNDALELAFHSKPLRTICESETEATHEFGEAVAAVLRHRLADLCAAKSPNDLPVGRPRALTSDPTKIGLDLCDGYVVTFCANHPNNPQTPRGLPDWEKVSRIKILEIARENDH